MKFPISNFQFSIKRQFSMIQFGYWLLVIGVLLVIGAWLLVIPAYAAGDSWPGTLVPLQCLASGDCGLCDILAVFMNLMRWIFVLGGGGALLMMIWGAIQWARSAGNTETIEEGKKIIFSAIVGVVIILLAWQLVYFVIATMVDKPFTDSGNIFKAFYSTPCSPVLRGPT